MKSKNFLVFNAIVVIAVAICIVVGYKPEIMTALIVGYVCSLSITAGMVATEMKKSEEKKKKEEEAGEHFTVGWGIGIGVIIGASLALCGGSFCESFAIAKFLFIGSVLGSIIGLMYKD